MTSVRVSRDVGFKRCCLGGKRYDGVMRDDYFR
jgi:hypothetical protein